ncbi:MAG: hypothetical protein ACRD3C_20620 [Vicinamibacterales bacterium]
MLTDSAQQRTITLTQPPNRFMGRATAHVRQFLCGLHGHDALLHFERGRISLICTSCGHQTPGWDVGTVPTRHEQAARSTSVVQLPLVGQRRAA